MRQLAISETCSRCGLCASICPWRVIETPDGGEPRFVTKGADRCNICGHCEAVCPNGAISVDDLRLIPTRHDNAAFEIKPEHLGAYLQMRRSIRRYREEPVDRSIIERMLDICRFAPSGRNRQDVRWLVIHETNELRRLTGIAIDWMRGAGSSGTPFAARFDVPGVVRAWLEGRDPLCHLAPHLVITYAPYDEPVARTNAIIALAHLEIVAPSFGLGSCWGGIFLLAAQCCDQLQAALGLPPGNIPVHCLMLGYPAVRCQRPPKRKPADVLWRQ